MGKEFVQTDDATVCGTTNLNSGLTATANPSDRLAVEGGDPGVTGDVFRCRNANGLSIVFEFAPGVAVWAAGTYVCPVNVTTVAGGTATISSAYVTRVPVGCSGGSLLKSVTGLSHNVNALGVKTVTIADVPESTGNTTDKCRIEIGTTAGASPLDPQHTPNQTITTPIEDPPPAAAPYRAFASGFTFNGPGYFYV